MSIFQKIEKLLQRTNGQAQTVQQESSALEPPEELRRPWTGDMVLCRVGPGEKVRYPLCTYSTEKVEWVSRELDERGDPVSVRIPKEMTRGFTVPLGFTAAGKPYLSVRQLITKKDGTETWGRDIYGREVLCLRERFPCFDSYDYANEHRYYRWFFLRESQKLTRVFCADGQQKIVVTEDVANLEQRCWDEMRRLNYFS